MSETILPVIVHGIPDELKGRRQWVAWKFITRSGKPTKTPINPDMGSFADATGPSTWGTFVQARARQRRDNLAGVGYAFSPADPYTGIDFDKCRDPETGEIDLEVRAMIGLLDSYTELSPSGTGLHVIIRAALNGNHNRTGHVEMYDQARYFTITGHRVTEYPAEINDRQVQLDQLRRRIFRDTTSTNSPSHNRPDAPSGASTLSGEVLWQWAYPRLSPRMMRIANCDDTYHQGDASRADEALFCALIGLGLFRAEATAAFRASPRGPYLAERKGAKHFEYLIERDANRAAAHVGEGKVL